MNIVKHIIQVLLLSTLLAGSMVSCAIGDDMTNCNGFVTLDYSLYPASSLEDVDPNTVVELFLFENDKNQKCVSSLVYTFSQVKTMNYTIPIPLINRGNSIVVWQGHATEQFMTDSMAVGIEKKDFRLELVMPDDTYSKIIEPLWASAHEMIEFRETSTNHTVQMLRIPNLFNVSVGTSSKGKATDKQMEMEKYEVSISSSNNIYAVDYNIHPDSKIKRYLGAAVIPSQERGSVTQVSVARLESDRVTRLAIKDRATGKFLTVKNENNIDVIKFITENIPSGSDKQKYLDTNHTWDLHLQVDENNIAISLRINEWTVWFNDADL